MPAVGTDIGRALEVLRRGGLVAIPTETVYGLAADATNAAAVGRIFAAKGRPADHPLIVHLASTEVIEGWAAALSPAAVVLADACWPGPLTMLVARGPRVIDAVTGARAAVGLRVPAHPLTTALLAEFGGGLAAPSANRFGHVSPTTAAHVVADLGDEVDYVLDGGPCPIGVESTIVDCTVDPPQLLRPGAITAEQIATLLGHAPAAAAGPSRAAGMLASHYAPRATVVLVDSADSLAAATAAAVGRVAVIGRSLAPDPPPGVDGSAASDAQLAHYAATLYAQLRDADEAGAAVIIAVLPPAAGLGHAIRDRLVKAAAPRT